MCKHRMSPVCQHFQPHPKKVYHWEGGSHSAHIPRGTVCFQPIGASVTTTDNSLPTASLVSLTFQPRHHLGPFYTIQDPASCIDIPLDHDLAVLTCIALLASLTSKSCHFTIGNYFTTPLRDAITQCYI